jgi:hypothetical protein
MVPMRASRCERAYFSVGCVFEKVVFLLEFPSYAAFGESGLCRRYRCGGLGR